MFLLQWIDTGSTDIIILVRLERTATRTNGRCFFVVGPPSSSWKVLPRNKFPMQFHVSMLVSESVPKFTH